jgi:glucose-6-phosphate 1-dehydrogenase
MDLVRPPAQDIIIVGASGDLSRRKLIPALYRLACQGLLPKEGRIVGGSRRDIGDDGFRALARESIEQFTDDAVDEAVWQDIAGRLAYRPVADGSFSGFAAAATEAEHLVYLAVPPEALEESVNAMAAANLIQGSRVVIEKPFGSDTRSAQALSDVLRTYFSESRIFRIEHYLGKEQVQNILVFRLG